MGWLVLATERSVPNHFNKLRKVRSWSGGVSNVRPDRLSDCQSIDDYIEWFFVKMQKVRQLGADYQPFVIGLSAWHAKNTTQRMTYVLIKTNIHSFKKEKFLAYHTIFDVFTYHFPFFITRIGFDLFFTSKLFILLSSSCENNIKGSNLYCIIYWKS